MVKSPHPSQPRIYRTLVRAGVVIGVFAGGITLLSQLLGLPNLYMLAKTRYMQATYKGPSLVCGDIIQRTAENAIKICKFKSVEGFPLDVSAIAVLRSNSPDADARGTLNIVDGGISCTDNSRTWMQITGKRGINGDCKRRLWPTGIQIVQIDVNYVNSRLSPGDCAISDSNDCPIQVEVVRSRS
jgi:hypothetical protein